ncbi:MAG: hypothetical protein WCG10_01950 [Chlamydiota bacterium]
MSIYKGMTFHEVAQAVTPIFKEGFENQKNTNKSLVELNTKINNTVLTILNDPSCKELPPEVVKEFTASITQEMTSLINKTATLKILANDLKESVSYTTRAHLDPTSLETIAYLDPKLANQVNTLFAQAMESHQELTKNYKDLEKLSQEQQDIIKLLQKNIKVLNKTVQEKGWFPTLCKKVTDIFQASPKNETTTEKKALPSSDCLSNNLAIVPYGQTASPSKSQRKKNDTASLRESKKQVTMEKKALPAPESNKLAIAPSEITISEPSIAQINPNNTTPIEAPKTAATKKPKISNREIKSLNIDPALDLSAPRMTRSMTTGANKK